MWLSKNEDGMTLVEVIVSVVLIVLLLTASTLGFAQIKQAQNVSSLRSQAHMKNFQDLAQDKQIPFDKISMSSSLKTKSPSDGGIGNVTTYQGEQIVFNVYYSDAVLPFEQDVSVNNGSYKAHKYVTKPANIPTGKYAPVRITQEIDLGKVGVIRDSVLVYPSYKDCPQLKSLDTNVSSTQGCK